MCKLMWPCVVGARAMGQAGPCGLGLSGCSLPGGVEMDAHVCGVGA